MIVNFRTCGINQVARKLTQTLMLIKKNIELSSLPSFLLFSFFSFFFFLLINKVLKKWVSRNKRSFNEVPFQWITGVNKCIILSINGGPPSIMPSDPQSFFSYLVLLYTWDWFSFSFLSYKTNISNFF
jgi:hypothetical protein